MCVCIKANEWECVRVCLRERASREMHIRMCVCSGGVREIATSEIDARMCGECESLCVRV